KGRSDTTAAFGGERAPSPCATSRAYDGSRAGSQEGCRDGTGRPAEGQPALARDDRGSLAHPPRFGQGRDLAAAPGRGKDWYDMVGRASVGEEGSAQAGMSQN